MEDVILVTWLTTQMPKARMWDEFWSVQLFIQILAPVNLDWNLWIISWTIPLCNVHTVSQRDRYVIATYIFINTAS